MRRILDLFSIDEHEKSEKILLCLPFDEADFYIALSSFKGMIENGKQQIFFLIPQAFFHTVKSIEDRFLLPLLSLHIKRNGTPSPQFFHDYGEYNFSCGIDLNPCLNITTATIIKKLVSNQRIGFKTEKSYKYFNIEIISKDIYSYYNKIKEILTNHIEAK